MYIVALLSLLCFISKTLHHYYGLIFGTHSSQTNTPLKHILLFLKAVSNYFGESCCSLHFSIFFNLGTQFIPHSGFHSSVTHP